MKGRKPKRRSRFVRGAAPRLRPTDELDWDTIAKELTKHFDSVEQAGARSALSKLMAAGCEERAILQNLYLFCGGDPQAMKDLRIQMDFANLKKQILRIAALLESVPSEIQTANKLLTDLGITLYFTPDSSSLQQFTKLLKQVGQRVLKDLAYGRVSGRDQHLVYLCWMITAATGRPHYQEIADLVASTERFYNPKPAEIVTADLIRKRVRNYKERTAE
jgi:hypothetical protein